jgi:hypothetical protein
VLEHHCNAHGWWVYNSRDCNSSFDEPSNPGACWLTLHVRSDSGDCRRFGGLSNLRHLPSQADLGPIILQTTQTYCTVAPTIWGAAVGDPNVDMAGINGSTVMNSYGNVNIVGNNCGP